MATRFGAVPTVTHVTPAAAVVATHIYEQPMTVTLDTLLHTADAVGCEKISRRTRNVPQRGIERFFNTHESQSERRTARGAEASPEGAINFVGVVLLTI